MTPHQKKSMGRDPKPSGLTPVVGQTCYSLTFYQWYALFSSW